MFRGGGDSFKRSSAAAWVELLLRAAVQPLAASVAPVWTAVNPRWTSVVLVWRVELGAPENAVGLVAKVKDMQLGRRMANPLSMQWVKFLNLQLSCCLQQHLGTRLRH